MEGDKRPTKKMKLAPGGHDEDQEHEQDRPMLSNVLCSVSANGDDTSQDATSKTVRDAAADPADEHTRQDLSVIGYDTPVDQSTYNVPATEEQVQQDGAVDNQVPSLIKATPPAAGHRYPCQAPPGMRYYCGEPGCKVEKSRREELVRHYRTSHPGKLVDGHKLEPEPDRDYAAASQGTLSKNQQKKMLKKRDWEAGREDRKVMRRIKIKEKKQKDRAARLDANAKRKMPSSRSGNRISTGQEPKRSRLPVAFVIDCGFDGLMMDKERVSLGAQLTRSYSENHKAFCKAHLYISSWGGELKVRFDSVLARHHENWKGVKFVTEDFVTAAAMAREAMTEDRPGSLAGAFGSYATDPDPLIKMLGSEAAANQELKGLTKIVAASRASPAQLQTFQSCVDAVDFYSEDAKMGSLLSKATTSAGSVEKVADGIQNLQYRCLEDGEVIYLTSDSPNTLEKLEPYNTYIIGGLVDKNRHKGICYQTALDKGVKTAKLPISQYMTMQSRFVLATNHVVEIMVRWLECGDWGKAFMDVMPKRKGGKLKEDTKKENTDGEDVDVDTEVSVSEEDDEE